MRNLILSLLFFPSLLFAAQPYAVVAPGGAVVNIVQWDGVTPYSVTPNTLVPATSAAQIGGTYVGGVFTAPVPVVTVPVSITAVQMRLALAQLNMLSQVTAAVNAGTLVEQTYWNYQDVYFRANPLLESIATAPPLSLTDAQIDQVFILAGSFAP